jgi:hypothetical protein
MVVTYSAGVCFNMLLLSTLCRRRELHRPMYSLTINLSIGDILFCIFVPPVFMTTQFSGRQILFGVACELAGFFTHFLAYQSMYTLIFLTVDRYWAIARPLRSLALRESTALYRGMCVATWLLAAILASPPLFGLSSYQYFPKIYGCQLVWGRGLKDVLYTVVVLGPLMFWPGCAIMTFVYVSIFRIARQSIREQNALQPQSQLHTSNSVLRRELRAAKSVIIILGIFALGWFPFVGLRWYAQITGVRFPRAEYYSQSLFVLPAVLNPLVYGWRNRELKAAFRKQWGIATAPTSEGNGAVTQTRVSDSSASMGPTQPNSS